MEVLEKAQADQLMLLTNGREVAVSARLKSLKPGEGLVIKRHEWKARYAPSLIARRLEKKLGWRFRSGRLTDNSGWLIQRLS